MRCFNAARQLPYCYLVISLFIFGCSSSNSGETKQQKIAHLLEDAFKKHAFVGNALVADSGHIIYQGSFGKASTGIVNSDSTRFLIASLSKPFTAVLILKLAEQGKVNITDELGKYLKIESNPRLQKVTIHHLLTHTSGIKELISEKQELQEADLTKAGFNFNPGADFEYSNSGYVILKMIAELRTGKPYKTLMQEQIFTPLQMTSSGIAANTNTISGLAIGYKNATQEQPDSITYSLTVVDGAGSIYSTTADILKFQQGINTPDFLSKASRNLLFSQHVKEKFGYGWFLRERSGKWDVAYHKGDLPGFTSFMSQRTSGNQMILLLGNAAHLDLDDLERGIAKILKAK